MGEPREWTVPLSDGSEETVLAESRDEAMKLGEAQARLARSAKATGEARPTQASGLNMEKGLGLARDIGIPMVADTAARMSGVGNAAIFGVNAATEFGVSKMRGESNLRAGLQGVGAGAVSVFLPKVAKEGMKKLPASVREPIERFFSGERSVAAMTSKVMAEADRFGPDTAKSVASAALSGREAGLKSAANKTLNQAAKRAPGKIITNKSLRETLESVVKEPDLTKFGSDAKTAARHALQFVQTDDSQTLQGANKIRGLLWKAFTNADPGDAKDVGNVVGLVDDLIEGVVDDPRTLSLLKRQRLLRSLRRKLFSDKGTGKPNLSRFFGEGTDEETRRLAGFVVDNSSSGSFVDLWRQAGRGPKGVDAHNGIRSLLLDKVDELGANPKALLKEMRNPKSLLRMKLGKAFHPGFHETIVRATKQAQIVQRAAGRIKPKGSFQVGGGGAAGFLAGQALPGLDPATGAAIGAGLPLATSALRGGVEMLGTGVGRRAAAGGLGQGARAAAQRELGQTPLGLLRGNRERER